LILQALLVGDLPATRVGVAQARRLVRVAGTDAVEVRVRDLKSQAAQRFNDSLDFQDPNRRSQTHDARELQAKSEVSGGYARVTERVARYI
jgi:hypothetical protein